ncbi:NAD-binding protein [Mycobacterium cookii]|nr:NAD-binding protein [Mycobacterium cookii]
MAVHQRILAVLTDPRLYWVLAPAAVFAFLLGCFGYLTWEPLEGSEHVHYSLSDALYGSSKLFFLHAAPQPESQVGLALDVARYLAPIVAGWAALIALIALLHDRAQRMLIPLRRNHVVLCGLGDVGFELLRVLRAANYRVVVIEADARNPRIEACRQWGGPVIVGDAQLKSTLEAAGVKRAARLLAVTPDDVVNTEIVTRARRLVKGSRRLLCLARVNNPSLCVFLRIEESNHGDDESALDFFNADEIGARLLLEAHPFDTATQPHILLAHLDTLGSELVMNAARRWQDERADSSAPLLVTVVDDDADQRIGSLLANYPVLEQVCEFTAYCTSARDLQRLSTARPAVPISRAYVTAQRDEQTVETALKLRHALDSAVPVVAALWQAYGVADLLENSTTQHGTNLTVFRTIQQTCSVDLVEGGSFEAIAHEIHRRYCLMQPDGVNPPPWSELDESLKKSNRAQARHIGVKLRSIGCEITPLRDWQAKDFTFTSDELTKLSIMEHDRWEQEKRDAGVKSDPHFLPWDQLPTDIAEWDTNFIRAIPAMLASVGLQIVDVREAAARYPNAAATAGTHP